MIEGALALWFNITAIAVLSFIAANTIVSLFVAVFDTKLALFEVKSRKYALWLTVTLPWLVALFVACYFAFISTTPSFAQQSDAYAHWHHMEEFSISSWHSFTLLMAMAVMAAILLKKLRVLHKHQHDLALLKQMSTPLSGDTYQLNTYQLNTEQSSAFTCGFINQRCYITSGLLDRTTLDEQQVILGHEQAHMLARDPLKKWIFNLLATFFVTPVAARLKLKMILAMEQHADNAVINTEYSSTFVAATLVKIARLNATENSLIDNELVASFGAEILEQRVYSLLGQLTLKPISRRLTLTFMIIVVSVSLYSIDGIHHLIETLFTH